MIRLTSLIMTSIRYHLDKAEQIKKVEDFMKELDIITNSEIEKTLEVDK